MVKILLLGASGLVGGEALTLALADPRIGRVVAPTRRALSGHAKLTNPVAVDLDTLLEAADGVDAIVCAFGTTRKKAGSEAAFRRIDHGIPLAFATRARMAGAATLALVSSSGASETSRFSYLRVKGDLERDLTALGFPSLTILRPGLIGGERVEARPAERFSMRLTSLLHPVLPRALRLNPAASIAEILIEAALRATPGRHIVNAAEIVGR